MDIDDALSRISIRKVTITLAVVSAAFTALGLVTQILSAGPSDQYTFTHMFDLDGEATMPAWYQTELLLVSALLSWLIGSARTPKDGLARYWKLLAGVFLYLSADENATIHETLGFWISKNIRHGMGVYAWLIPGAAFVIYMGFESLKAFRVMPPAIRRGLILAAAVYLFGAFGFEIIESRLDDLWGTLPFSMLTIVEETCEMAGLVILIHTLLSQIKSFPKGPTLTVE